MHNVRIWYMNVCTYRSLLRYQGLDRRLDVHFHLARVCTFWWPLHQLHRVSSNQLLLPLRYICEHPRIVPWLWRLNEQCLPGLALSISCMTQCVLWVWVTLLCFSNLLYTLILSGITRLNNESHNRCLSCYCFVTYIDSLLSTWTILSSKSAWLMLKHLHKWMLIKEV